MSSHHSRRLAALEARQRQQQAEQAKRGDPRERILARLATMRRRMEASGEVFEPVSEEEAAQLVAAVQARLQTRCEELGVRK